MRTPCPQRGIEQFDERDSFLFGVLGLVSALAGFEGLLDRHAPTAPPGGATAGAAGSDGDDDDVLMALLGLAALQRACRRNVEHVATAAREPARAGRAEERTPGASEEPARPAGGSLLR